MTPLTTNECANRALVVRCKFLHSGDASYEAEYKLLCELDAYKVLDTLNPENSDGGTSTLVANESYAQLGSSCTYMSGRCGKKTNNRLSQIASVLTKLLKVAMSRSVDDGGLCVARINKGSCVFFAVAARCAAQPMGDGTVVSGMTIGGGDGFGGAAGRGGGAKGVLPDFATSARLGCSSLFEAAHGFGYVSKANPNPQAFAQNISTADIGSLHPETVRIHRTEDRRNVVVWLKEENRGVTFDCKSTAGKQLCRTLQASSAQELQDECARLGSDLEREWLLEELWRKRDPVFNQVGKLANKTCNFKSPTPSPVATLAKVEEIWPASTA